MAAHAEQRAAAAEREAEEARQTVARLETETASFRATHPTPARAHPATQRPPSLEAGKPKTVPLELAVVIPLEDPRGDVVKHLRTWTRSQTLPRERFQVVLGADGRHPEFERQVASELAPQDEIVGGDRRPADGPL